MPLQERLLSAKQAAQQLGISERTLRRYCQQKHLAYIRYPGGTVKIRQSTVDYFLANHTISPKGTGAG